MGNHAAAVEEQRGPHPQGLVNVILFVALVLAIGYAFLRVLQPFVTGLAWASVLAIAIQPVYRRLKKRLSAARAALLTTVGVALALIAPASFLVLQLASECLQAADRLVSAAPGARMQLMHSAQEFWLRVQSRFPGLSAVDPAQSINDGLLRITKQIAAIAGGLAQNLLAFLATVVIVLLALYFLLRDGPALVRWLRRLSPLDGPTTDRLFEEIRMLTEGSVTATLLIAMVQGVLGGVWTAILGLPSPVMWGAVFGFCSLIPVIGTALAWIPAVVWLLATGHEVRALVMLLASVLMIGQTDNLIRSALVSGRSRLSFQLSMLSVLGGVAAFGMLGLILGPVVVAVMTAIVDVYLESKESAATGQ